MRSSDHHVGRDGGGANDFLRLDVINVHAQCNVVQIKGGHSCHADLYNVYTYVAHDYRIITCTYVCE